MKNKSECCDAQIYGSLGDGVLLGTCAECQDIVCRMNPRTGANEWLDGESPWTPRDDLRKMDDEDQERDQGVLSATGG